MALLFIDGCTHYSTDDILLKWSEGTSATILADYPRRPGSKSIRPYAGFPVTTKPWPSKDFLVVGFAVHTLGSYFAVDLYKGSQGQVRLDLNSNTLTVSRGAGAVPLASMNVEGLIYPSEWYYFEFAARIHDTLGTTQVRLNGIELPGLTLSGVDTKPSTAEGIDRAKFLGSSITRYTDIYVDDVSFHGDCLVETLMATGAGGHAQWTPLAGANYQNIDDPGVVDGDTSYNCTLTQGAKDSFATADLQPRPASAIKGLSLHVIARKDAPGGRVVKPMLRVGGGDFVHSDDGLVLSDVYHGMQRIWATNPQTGEAWTESGVNGAEMGYQLSLSA